MTAVQSLLSSWNSISPWKENSLWIPILGGSTIPTTTSHRFVWLWLYCETIQELEIQIAKTGSQVSGIHVRYYLERYHSSSKRVGWVRVLAWHMHMTWHVSYGYPFFLILSKCKFILRLRLESCTVNSKANLKWQIDNLRSHL